MNSIEVKNISKNYGAVCALDQVNLRFEENKIYGLFGRNGAGKTTLLNIITGRIFADHGEVTVNGEIALENDAALQKMYLASEATLYPEGMKVKEAFRWSQCFYANFDPVYAEKTAARFGLDCSKKIKTLSTGFNSIFKLVIALSVNTPYLLFDEPILGLDANNRDLFYRLLIEKFSVTPCTIIISTHLIDEVASVVGEVVIIKNGTIIRNESCEALLAQGYTASGPAGVMDLFLSDKKVLGCDVLGGLKTAYILGEKGGNLPKGIEISKLDLQKLFIQLTNS